jgi:hypothetical protein
VELTPVVGRTADRGPGEVEDPMVSRGVFPASATDYEGGRARLKVGVFSAGFVALSGGFLELTYGRDTLRLEGSQPPHALSAEGTVRLPVVAPGEAGSVACLFEPLVPGRHLLEATLTFYDDANNPRHMEVPSREFEVAFPRLALETPPGSLEGTQRMGMDEARRCWRYPASLGGLDVLRTARTVLGTRGLVLTPGEEVPGPPPEWSVEGRALAGPSPLVLGIRVTGGEARRLELRVASPSGSVTAGAVAEMRKLMLEAFFKRWRGQVELEEEPTGPAREPEIPPTDIDIYVPAR